VAIGVAGDRGSLTQIGIPMAEVTKPRIVRDEVTACVHHWVLNDPEAGAVSGRCKRCGGERLFTARVGAPDRSADEVSDEVSETALVDPEVERLAG